MKRLLIALMALSLVLFAVSFAAAQSSTGYSSIEAFQNIIPPGNNSANVAIPGFTATITTTYPMPVQSFIAAAGGSASGLGTFSASAGGGGSQSAYVGDGVSGSYHTSQGVAPGADWKSFLKRNMPGD